jgi:hypothetical protein
VNPGGGPKLGPVAKFSTLGLRAKGASATLGEVVLRSRATRVPGEKSLRQAPMSSQLSAHAITAHTAMTKMSISR